MRLLSAAERISQVLGQVLGQRLDGASPGDGEASEPVEEEDGRPAPRRHVVEDEAVDVPAQTTTGDYAVTNLPMDAQDRLYRIVTPAQP